MPSTWRLETKHCKCGCGRSWRALPSSPNEYFSSQHDPEWWNFRDRFPKEDQGRRRDYYREFNDDLESDEEAEP